MPNRTQRAGNLPAEVTSFVGRRREIAEVRRALGSARVVSLVGPGGVGKTRLALRVAAGLGRGFHDGAWWAELAELHDPSLVTNTVLAALDLRDQSGTEPATLLREYLTDKNLLLVFDNCEHLLDPVAQLVGELLRAAPDVRVLTTTREPLSAVGEHVIPVPPFELPSQEGTEPISHLRQNDAVTLFVQRAAAASGGFELTASNRVAVTDLCLRLDGLPLAIELAAVRIRALSPEQIRARLSARFDVLTGGGRAAIPRHQTLRATIDWSYDLLTAAERTLLARLGVFAGRFTLDDVAAVCSSEHLPAGRTLDLMCCLLDKSMLTRDDLSGTVCYRLHETMREYTRLKMQDTAERPHIERRLAEHYLSQCGRFAAEGRYRLLDWLAWMEVETDNVRAVLRRQVDTGQIDQAIGLASNLIWFWITRATSEGVRWFDELLARDPAPNAHAWAYFGRGFLAVLQADPAAALPTLERGVAAARGAGISDALAQSLAMASIAANMAGDRRESRRMLDEACAIADDLDDLGATLMTYQAKALNGILERDLAAAKSAAAEGERLSRAAGDVHSLGMMLLNQGFVALLSGDYREAERRFTEGLRIAHQLDGRVHLCHLLGGLACCAAAQRQPQLAAQLLGAMERLLADAGATTNPGLAPALEQATAAATAALGPSRFASQVAAGRALNRHDAVRLALHEPPAPIVPNSVSPDAEILGHRQAEVALLVGQGLSNKEIGARLFISERTVESHVRNILNHLGFTSRAQIAHWTATSNR